MNCDFLRLLNTVPHGDYLEEEVSPYGTIATGGYALEGMRYMDVANFLAMKPFDGHI